MMIRKTKAEERRARERSRKLWVTIALLLLHVAIFIIMALFTNHQASITNREQEIPVASPEIEIVYPQTDQTTGVK